MSLEPPPFQEAARCYVCNCSFNTFRRRHHCRCCGRTLCHDHSSDQMALPQFGIYTNVRVCADCFNNSRPGGKDPQLSHHGINAATDSVSRLNLNDGEDEDVNVSSESSAKQQPSPINIPECKCGMPLCICEAPAPAPAPVSSSLKIQTAYVSQSQSKDQRPKKVDHVPKNTTSASNSKPSSFLNSGQTTNGSWQKPTEDYEVNGEGLKEAIKNSDTAAVKKLLSEGVDANYCDKQGFSLLHLAAVFNQTEITFVLMDYGANVGCKNQQGETPLDCAPPMLQHKMKNKMEEN